MVERGFGFLLGHRAAALQPDTRQEHLLVQPQSTPADQHHAGDRGDERLRQVGDDDGGHPVQRGINAPQRTAKQPLGFLHDRMAEVHIHQITAALGGLRVERDRPQHTRIQPGIQTLEGVLPTDGQARQLEDLGVGARHRPPVSAQAGG